jgi:hypothetical protein
MEEQLREKGRFGLYAQSLLYLGLTVWSGIGSSQSIHNSEILGYIAPAGYGLITLYTGYAAIKRYRAGFWFVFANLLLGLVVISLSVLYDAYRSANTNTITGTLAFVALFTLLAVPLFWVGHKRHRRLWRIAHGLPEVEAAPAPVAIAIAENGPLLLYPPQSTWRLLLLMMFSSMLYSPFLLYRIVSDLRALGGSQLNPKRCAWQMLIPLYNFNVFYQIARQVERLGRNGSIFFKFSPAMLALILVGATLTNFAMPRFLFALSCAMSALPWLILNAWMNRLRNAQSAQWREPTASYTWRQRGVFLAGVPIIALALLGSKTEFAYYKASALATEQQVSGPGAEYYLTIPDRQWRVVARGTLYPDTDMELINKTTGEWVVVRISPSQQQTLNGFVDQRQALIAANWSVYDIQESRSFAVGTEDTPMSLARYSQKGGIVSRDSPLVVATVLTPARVFEVLGHAATLPNASASQLIESFRLAGTGKKS